MDQRVIRGLPRKMSVDDIKEDLVSQGIADAEVQQMTSRTTKKPLPLFLVKTKMPEKLLEIQRLAMLTVSFERKKRSTEPSQCYRCQRYGHTQRNCRLAERKAENQEAATLKPQHQSYDVLLKGQTLQQGVIAMH
ncbi:unnamed protein product [Acanthoscelides obtectus]|uniref:CCHC-type domain-containing protein n=1 Tax=Acanthoscelides obtectus TaxID=200917 RepID=A0A9P0NZN0_ACAOB|nr:unnamed protein product [Acanthoscelides obtectus]CAK1639444.1 hypothetical protein AOBTE_LOCUS11183 [Acanthoscelides obtectus]